MFRPKRDMFSLNSHIDWNSSISALPGLVGTIEDESVGLSINVSINVSVVIFFHRTQLLTKG